MKEDFSKEEKLPLESEETVDKSFKSKAGKSKSLIKKDATVNIGSVDGGKDRVIILKKGESLPEEIDKKFFSSLKAEQII